MARLLLYICDTCGYRSENDDEFEVRGEECRCKDFDVCCENKKASKQFEKGFVKNVRKNGGEQVGSDVKRQKHKWRSRQYPFRNGNKFIAYVTESVEAARHQTRRLDNLSHFEGLSGKVEAEMGEALKNKFGEKFKDWSTSRTALKVKGKSVTSNLPLSGKEKTVTEMWIVFPKGLPIKDSKNKIKVTGVHIVTAEKAGIICYKQKKRLKYKGVWKVVVNRIDYDQLEV